MSSVFYTGPQCPACSMPIGISELRTGTMTCLSCSKQFEATAFSPREVRPAAVQVVTETPDGIAAACANHARNAAVTSCSRCGLFICSLCEMSVGEITYCPSCFDRVSSEGTLEGTTRYRDYAAMGVAGAVVGLFCSIPVGPFAVFWSIRGIAQRKREGSGIVGPIISLIFGLLETAAGLAFFGAMVWGMFQGVAGAAH